MALKKLRVVHYLNQFFGGLGGEDKAHVGPQIVEGFRGPGLALNRQLVERGEIVATAICGDDYFAERVEEAAGEILELIRGYRPDVVIAGPAFEAGRYGVACGALCRKVQGALGIPAVAGMYEENPGVELFHTDVYIAQTGDSVRSMNEAIAKMVNLALKLAAGEAIGKPAIEGYFPRGKLVNEEAGRSGAERVVAMLLQKLKGEPFETEVLQPTHFPVAPAPAIKDLAQATIALVTDGGLVPAGNPDGIELRGATRFGKYDFAGIGSLIRETYDVCHGGYATDHTRADPNRLIPVDAMRELERERQIGKLHERFYSTSGVATRLELARKMGRSIAAELKADGVSGVILTST